MAKGVAQIWWVGPVGGRTKGLIVREQGHVPNCMGTGASREMNSVCNNKTVS